MKNLDAINALVEIRDYLRESLNGEIPQPICDDFNSVISALTGRHHQDWCMPKKNIPHIEEKA